MKRGKAVVGHARAELKFARLKRIAEAYLGKLGWAVENVSRHRSYDFHCKKTDAELRVEVKGTTSAGDEVILTPKEVIHARGEFPNVALIVVANIRLSNEEKPSGGDIHFVAPWKIEENSLKPLGFSHIVPSRN